MEEEEFRCVVCVVCAWCAVCGVCVCGLSVCCVCVCVLNLLSWDTHCTCRRHFKELFDDEEEMNEAVFYLNLQGTYVCIHFTYNVVLLD